MSFVAKVKNVHVMCTSRKIMGIKSPLKVFSAARQKIVLQMGASDEREGAGGRPVALDMAYTGDFYQE